MYYNNSSHQDPWHCFSTMQMWIKCLCHCLSLVISRSHCKELIEVQQWSPVFDRHLNRPLDVGVVSRRLQGLPSVVKDKVRSLCQFLLLHKCWGLKFSITSWYSCKITTCIVSLVSHSCICRCPCTSYAVGNSNGCFAKVAERRRRWDELI